MSSALAVVFVGLECLALILLLFDSAMAAQLTLTWLGTDGATEYSVERELASLGTFAEIARVVAATSYVDSGVLAGLTYCYRVRAVSAAGYSDYSNMACGAPAAGGGSFADDFNRPDSATLGNGWTTVAGNLMIRSGQARNSSVKTMHMAVQPGLTGASQTISASFASLDNNLGPRFALLVRYQDPRNYYVCYRQIGGSSALRISRVVGGVETILKSYPVSNPTVRLLFTLGCQAQGTTLRLSLGALKLSASDTALSTGTVGIAIGHPVAGTGAVASHVADNFTAVVQ